MNSEEIWIQRQLEPQEPRPFIKGTDDPDYLRWERRQLEADEYEPNQDRE